MRKSLLILSIFAVALNTYAQAPTVTFTATPSIICAGGYVTFKDSNTYYPTSWTWYFPGGIPSKDTNSIAPGNPHSAIQYNVPGTYYVTCVVKNQLGMDSVTVQNCVIVKPLPTAVIEPASGGICDTLHGNPLDTVFFSVIDTNPGNTYSWIPASTLSCSNCPNPLAYPSVTTVYTLTVTDFDGCSITLFDTVSVGYIVAKITGHDSICKGSADTLYASGGANNPPSIYSWSNGATTSSIIVRPANTISYSVTITSGINHCTSSSAFTVHVFPMPNFIIMSRDSICYPGTATISALPSNGYQYIWYAPSASPDTNSSITVAPNATTTYTLAVKNIGCVFDTLVKIKVNYPPSVTFTGPDTLCSGNSATLTVSGGTQYRWSTGQTTSSIQIIAVATRTYTVQVRSGACFKDTSFTISVDTCLGIPSISNQPEILVYPNPANSILNVSIEKPIAETSTIIEVSDITGRVLITQKIYSSQFNIDVSSLSPGIYFLKLQTMQGMLLKKFVKD